MVDRVERFFWIRIRESHRSVMRSREGIRRLSCLLSLLATMCLFGCNKAPSMVQVRGKVLNSDGSPVKGGIREIRFEPARDVPHEGLRTASGTIETDGSYHLFTRKPDDGIMPGTYN